MVQPETAAATAQSATMRAAVTGTAGSSGGGMMGGAPYGPMAGQGANNSSNSHTAAAFLHTSDQGGEIVGDLGTAAPPVLGAAESNEPPDVELRI
jgi:predicted lipid-binding transport protein (Tim44 family)